MTRDPARRRPLSLYVSCAALFAASLAVFLGGYLLGRSDLGIEQPAAATAATAASVGSEEATLKPPPSGPTEDPQTVDPPPPIGDQPPRLSPVMSPMITPMQKGYDLSRYLGKVVNRSPYKTKKVAITFDDGPTKNTGEVLRVLRENNAKATFFFCGYRMVGREPVVRQAVEQGSEVANHTYSHVELRNMSAKQLEDEIVWTQTEIERVTGVRNSFVRPHGGQYDRSGMRVVKRLRLVLLNWDAYGEDTFLAKTNAEQIEQYAVTQAHGGSILLLHETNPATIEALPGIITRIRAEGYEFVTVNELLSHK